LPSLLLICFLHPGSPFSCVHFAPSFWGLSLLTPLFIFQCYSGVPHLPTMLQPVWFAYFPWEPINIHTISYTELCFHLFLALFLDCLTHDDGAVGCPITSVNSYQHMLHNK
jgi:hypothetical protein